MTCDRNIFSSAKKIRKKTPINCNTNTQQEPKKIGMKVVQLLKKFAN